MSGDATVSELDQIKQELQRLKDNHAFLKGYTLGLWVRYKRDEDQLPPAIRNILGLEESSAIAKEKLPF